MCQIIDTTKDNEVMVIFRNVLWASFVAGKANSEYGVSNRFLVIVGRNI